MPKRLLDEGLKRGLNYNGGGGANPSMMSVPQPSSPNADTPTDTTQPRIFVQPRGVDSAANGRPARGPQPPSTNTGVLQPSVPGVGSQPGSFDPLDFAEAPTTPTAPRPTTSPGEQTLPAEPTQPGGEQPADAAQPGMQPPAPPVYRGDSTPIAEGMQMPTAAGVVSRRGGEDRMQLNPLGRRAYRAAHAKSVASFGDFPGRGDASQPQPVIIPGQPNYNPFTGKWTE